MITFPLEFRYGLIDYTCQVDRNRSSVEGEIIYTVKHLNPFMADAAMEFVHRATGQLKFEKSDDPLLSQFIATEISRKIVAMNLEQF